jgi:hypothetical protein
VAADRALTRRFHHHDEKGDASTPDRRRIHHSPWFWVGVAMFLTAILTYVFSEDLSLRPRRQGTAAQVEGRSPVKP